MDKKIISPKSMKTKRVWCVYVYTPFCPSSPLSNTARILGLVPVWFVEGVPFGSRGMCIEDDPTMQVERLKTKAVTKATGQYADKSYDTISTAVKKKTGAGRNKCFSFSHSSGVGRFYNNGDDTQPCQVSTWHFTYFCTH